jgi:hypothetical protein
VDQGAGTGRQVEKLTLRFAHSEITGKPQKPSHFVDKTVALANKNGVVIIR